MFAIKKKLNHIFRNVFDNLPLLKLYFKFQISSEDIDQSITLQRLKRFGLDSMKCYVNSTGLAMPETAGGDASVEMNAILDFYKIWSEQVGLSKLSYENWNQVTIEECENAAIKLMGYIFHNEEVNHVISGLESQGLENVLKSDHLANLGDVPIFDSSKSHVESCKSVGEHIQLKLKALILKILTDTMKVLFGQIDEFGAMSFILAYSRLN